MDSSRTRNLGRSSTVSRSVSSLRSQSFKTNLPGNAERWRAFARRRVHAAAQTREAGPPVGAIRLQESVRQRPGSGL